METHLPPTQLPWVWHDSTMLTSWSLLDRSEEWLSHVEPIIATAPAVAENRTDRFELLNSATYAYHQAGRAEQAFRLADLMKELLAEDPDWHDRQWAEDRVRKQNIDFALRAKNFEAARDAARGYVEWGEAQDPPVYPHGEVAALFLWSGDHATAMEYGELRVAVQNQAEFADHLGDPDLLAAIDG